MQHNHITELDYLLHSNLSIDFGLSTSNLTPAQQSFSNPLYHQLYYSTPQVQECIPKSTCLISSNSTTSDETDEQQLSIINERKKRRMISNRESARRSRVRKQKQLDELWSQVVWLRNENQQLVDKLNHISESHDQLLQENVELKEEASELRQMLTHQLNTSSCPNVQELDDIDEPCNDSIGIELHV